MTTTVRELYKKLGDYSADAVVIIIAAADDQEFAIINFTLGARGLTTLIDTKEDEEDEG